MLEATSGYLRKAQCTKSHKSCVVRSEMDDIEAASKEFVLALLGIDCASLVNKE